jgi:uncharacterized protein
MRIGEDHDGMTRLGARKTLAATDKQVADQKRRLDQERLDTHAFKAGRSRLHGYGLFAKVDLPARKKLGEMSGHYVKLPEARKRVESLPVIQLVELGPRLALDCRDGNDFKYLNHSCKPNAYLRIYGKSVEVYALREIKKGEELTVDYGVTPHKRGMQCHCGAEKCGGTI